jgi:hypothetical protein
MPASPGPAWLIRRVTDHADGTRRGRLAPSDFQLRGVWRLRRQPRSGTPTALACARRGNASMPVTIVSRAIQQALADDRSHPLKATDLKFGKRLGMRQRLGNSRG